MLEASSLRELHVHLDGDSVYVSRNEGGCKMVAPPEEAAASAPKTAITVSEAEPVKEKEADVPEGELILSPLVGTFFASAAPEKPAFVRVGETVKAGQVLCIVEAMKVMNEITAKRDGVVAEVLAVNEQLVEFNQPLIRIV